MVIPQSAYPVLHMAPEPAPGYDARSMEELADALAKLGRTLRRLTMYLEFFAIRVSSVASDTRVIVPPTKLVPLKRQKFSNN